jgi:Raf kinase inhibitor-like YbhB/YbcL family protein
VCALAWLAGCGGGDKPSEPPPQVNASIGLTSPAFRDHGTIPKRYTCSGEGISPPLRWTGLVGRARELTLLVEDIDAGRFVHWIVLRIPPDVDHIDAGRIPAGAVETKNSFGDKGWGGPCPPEGKGPHRYVFALYETDAPLGLDSDASPDDVHGALAKQAIAVGKLFGRFSR